MSYMSVCMPCKQGSAKINYKFFNDSTLKSAVFIKLPLRWQFYLIRKINKKDRQIAILVLFNDKLKDIGQGFFMNIMSIAESAHKFHNFYK